VWRQSQTALITPRTTDVLLISEILPEVNSGTLDGVVHDLIGGLGAFGVVPSIFIADEQRPMVSW
jgi:DNA/RNA-binding domain of Phe-tRNA-synthetase-like protein